MIKFLIKNDPKWNISPNNIYIYFLLKKTLTIIWEYDEKLYYNIEDMYTNIAPTYIRLHYSYIYYKSLKKYKYEQISVYICIYIYIGIVKHIIYLSHYSIV